MLGDDATELDVDVTRAAATESFSATSQPALPLALPSDNVDAGMPQTADEPPRRASDGEPTMSSSIIAATVGGASASTLVDGSTTDATLLDPCKACSMRSKMYQHTCGKKRKERLVPDASGRSSRRRTASSTAATAEPALTMNADESSRQPLHVLALTGSPLGRGEGSETPIGARETTGAMVTASDGVDDAMASGGLNAAFGAGTPLQDDECARPNVDVDSEPSAQLPDGRSVPAASSSQAITSMVMVRFWRC